MLQMENIQSVNEQFTFFKKGDATYVRLIVLVHPVFLNCTILKILNTLESLTSFSVRKVWPSSIDKRLKRTKKYNGADDIVAVDEL